MPRRKIAHLVMIAGIAVVVNGSLVQAGSCCGSGASGSSTHSGCSDHSAADVSRETLGPHGGTMTTTKANLFETVLLADGVRIYRYTMQENPRSMDEAYGKVEIQLPGGTKSKLEFQRNAPEEGDPGWFCPMHATVVRQGSGSCPICGMALVAQDFLYAPIDLSPLGTSGFQSGPVVAKVELKGLGEPEDKAKFTQGGLAVTDSATSATRLGSTEGKRQGTEHIH